MLDIRRVDHEASSTHCWRVSVQRRKQRFTRDFSEAPEVFDHQVWRRGRVPDGPHSQGNRTLSSRVPDVFTLRGTGLSG